MSNILGGLVIASILLVIALIVTLAGALGVGAIGWIMHRLFDLSQWQGTVISFGVAVTLGAAIYKILSPSPWDLPGFDLSFDDDEFDDYDEEDEPPIVPWRRSRPSESSQTTEKNPSTTGRGKRRK